MTIQQFIINLTNCIQESVSFDCELRAVKEIVNSSFNIQTTRATGIYRMAFRSLESSLFHSITADGKNEFLKKLCLMLKYGTSSAFLIL